jgi:hypothetical protein
MPADSTSAPRDASEVAARLVALLEAEECDYAIGGALALGYWAVPRSTIDVDVTLYLSPDKPRDCLALLARLGCEFDSGRAESTLVSHGFCQVKFLDSRLDVFLPLVDFYETAKARRRLMPLGGGKAWIWDAETLCVFKMMFFRPKDLVDVQSLLREQAAALDRSWVEAELVELYGQRDPRITRWRELVAEASG